MGGVLARRRRLSLILAAHLPLLVCAAASSTGEVRCFCNVPPCVTTGYMCKSALGACFSEARLSSTPAGPGARLHGCLDMLHRDQQEACGEDGGAGAGLLCCSTDMCNHVDGLALAHAHSRQYAAWHHGRFNATALSGAAVNASASARDAVAAAAESPAYASGEVWLKAATIAVPVCGVVILVALVAAAVRILRRDARELAAACKAAPLARCKAPLLPTHHHHHHHHHPQEQERRPDKNEANARRNRAAAHPNLFRGDAASAGPAGEPPAKLYHKAAIAWRPEPCACPV